MKLTTRDRSNAQEKRCQGYYDAIINPNSGAVNNYAFKADLRNHLHLFECKCTAGASITIKKEDIYKVKKQARLNGKKFILNIEFQKEDPNDTKSDFINNPQDAFYNLTLIPTEDFIEIYKTFESGTNQKDNSLVYSFIEKVINNCSTSVKDEILFLLDINKSTELKQLKNFIK